MLQIDELGPARPPCSIAEREAADALRRSMRRNGLRPSFEKVRAPTSPTWAPLLRALARVWGGAFLAAGWPSITIGLGAVCVLGGVPAIAGLIRFIPLLGARTRNVVALKRGTDQDARSIVACAHLDSHPTAGAPLHRFHAFLAALSGWLILGAAIAVRRSGFGWTPVAGVVAIEAVVTMGWLAWRELMRPKDPPDDNTSGLLALARLAELVSDGSQRHDVWLVGTAGGTSGSYGILSFLRHHKDLREGWLVEIDALGTGEVVASPFGARFPYPGTALALVRSVVTAAREGGDPLTVRRIARPHSDARTALRRRVPALTLTAGLRAPAEGHGPDPANAERAARIIDGLARLED